MRPLDDIRVIDLTRVLAGPYATMVLADLGAEVIKIESFEGDEARGFGPFKNGVSGYFQSVNRGKKSLALDLKHPEAKILLKKLIAKSDVLVENFRPGAMARLGLDYQTLSTEVPGLIYAACSGFGQTGPLAQKGAYDVIIQGMGGIVGITGEPGRPPIRVGVSIGDLSAALFCAIGILSALTMRRHTGRGQLVDISMLDCQVALLENAIARFDITGESPGPLGSRHPSITPFQSFQTSDGWMTVAAGNNLLWAALCSVLNVPTLIHDPRFLTNDLRTTNHACLEPLLSAPFSMKTKQEWIQLLECRGVPCGPIQSVREVVQHPQVLAREMIQTIDHPVAGTLKVPGSPLKFSDAQPMDIQRAPELGEHTDELLQRLLTFSAADLSRLRRHKVIS